MFVLFDMMPTLILRKGGAKNMRVDTLLQRRAELFLDGKWRQLFDEAVVALAPPSQPKPPRPAHANNPGVRAHDRKAFAAMDQARAGYHLNQFCMSLMKDANRKRFLADQRAYLDEWPMTEEQKQSVLTVDLNRAMKTGGNIYFLAKLGATHGLSFQQMAGSMTGMTELEYRDMMIAGGRSVEGNRVIGEDGDAQANHQPQGAAHKGEK